MIHNPSTIPLTSIAILEQTSQSFSNTMYRLVSDSGSIMEAFSGVRAIYEMEQVKNLVKDGQTTYPPNGREAQKGMEIEFKNVCFKYPRNDATVIDDLSFKIDAGSIVVIVGENGCGKSSMLKLLARTYDVISGEVLIDGTNIKDYRVEDLRNASAFMHQDYQHFNFSVSSFADTCCVAEAKLSLDSSARILPSAMSPASRTTTPSRKPPNLVVHMIS